MKIKVLLVLTAVCIGVTVQTSIKNGEKALSGLALRPASGSPTIQQEVRPVSGRATSFRPVSQNEAEARQRELSVEYLRSSVLWCWDEENDEMPTGLEHICGTLAILNDVLSREVKVWSITIT